MEQEIGRVNLPCSARMPLEPMACGVAPTAASTRCWSTRLGSQFLHADTDEARWNFCQRLAAVGWTRPRRGALEEIASPTSPSAPGPSLGPRPAGCQSLRSPPASPGRALPHPRPGRVSTLGRRASPLRRAALPQRRRADCDPRALHPAGGEGARPLRRRGGDRRRRPGRAPGRRGDRRLRFPDPFKSLRHSVSLAGFSLHAGVRVPRERPARPGAAGR
jgi:hypothetical protein